MSEANLIFAQEELLDSLRVFEADPIIVTADRYQSFKLNSTSAISVVSENDLILLPVNKLSEAIGTAPSIVFMHKDGLGEDPILNVRGFYGGGEAEYMLVLVDGRPLNDLESDLVNWNALPINDVVSMEILKGQSSSLYGNIALGGVLNIRTKQRNQSTVKLSAWGGSYDNYRAQLSYSTHLFKIYGSFKNLTGYRQHADRQNYTLGGTVHLFSNKVHTVDFSLINYWTDFNLPGPLSGPELEQNRRASSAFYKFDSESVKKHKAWIDWSWNINERFGLDISFAGEYRQADIITTLPLSPEFADTKDRSLTTKRFEALFQLRIKSILSSFDDNITFGIDGSVGSLNSDYFQYFQGGLNDYESASAQRGEMYAKGDGNRDVFAIYLQYDIQPVKQFKLTIGGRYDRISDKYDQIPPSDPVNMSVQHAAFSPKIGLNYNYLTNPVHKGNVYLNLSRSFKAPTIDQLYNQRSIPTPFPPYSIILSNELLKPQRGSGGELGIYHNYYLNDINMMSEFSLAVYSMDMKDEIDFDIDQFKYVNIGKSRHRGIELGLKMQWLAGIMVYINYANQEATLQYGNSKGKYLKAVPRNIIAGGLTSKIYAGLAAGITVRSHRDIYLDDQNTIILPDYTNIDLKASYTIKKHSISTSLFVEILNLFDKKYSSTGFPDPASTPGLVYYFPAAERNLRIGLIFEL